MTQAYLLTRSRLYKKVLGSIAVLMLATACQTVQTTSGGVVGVNRQQKMVLSSAKMDQMSSLAYTDTLQKAKGAGSLNVDAAMIARVNRITQRVIQQVPAFRPDALNWKWEVNTIRSDVPNAHVMAGGKIIVNSGLITQIKITDDELAAVMGHEIAHALREHAREQESMRFIGDMAVFAGQIAGVDGQTAGLASEALNLFGLKHSRRDETEADLIGVELAARAGYDPRASITFWQKMAALGGNRPIEFLSTHPSPENRQVVLREASAKVLPLYQQAQANLEPPREQRAAPVPAKKRVLKRK